jgi:ATP-dependent helicase/nuclease subunit B
VDNSFLKQVTQYLQKLHPEALDQICLVLPNRRAMVFLKKYLQETYGTSFISPEIYSVEDFLVQISDVQMVDSTELLFDFYQIYTTVETGEKESFEDFSRWGLTLMRDFNDLDSHNVEPTSFFKYVYEYFALTQWSPEQQEFSDFQKRYLHFWKNIAKYYDALQLHFKATGKAYQGYMLRKSIHELKQNESTVFTRLKSSLVYFVGFNAMTTAEIALIESFLVKNKARVLFDADPYYIEKQVHEAGHFIRMLLAKDVWKNNSYVFWSDGFKQEKQIFVEPVSGNVLQAKRAAQVISASNTALILNDEDLLLPVLNSLPDQSEKINITLGFPVKNTNYYLFFKKLFENFTFFEREGYYYHKHITDLLLQPVSVFSSQEVDFLKDKYHEIVQKNLVRVYASFLKSPIDGGFYMDILTWQSLPLEASLMAIDQWMLKAIEYLSVKAKDHHQKMQVESLFQLQKIIKQIRSYVLKYSFINSWSMIHYVFEQQAKAQSIPFIGEPLGGLQIMGMLETRLLDFENVVILSVNEGFLPKDKFENSFIPFDIRRHYKISTHIEKDAVFSYHFYRLLQRAKNVHIFYNTSSADDFSRSEPSRYILQLAYEFPVYNAKAKLTFLPAYQSTPMSSEKLVVVEKTDLILKKLTEFLTHKGFSASSLNTYLRCPLDFYNKYILGVGEDKELEEDLEDNTLGTMIHKVLENLYKPYEGKLLRAHDISDMRIQADVFIKEVLFDFYQLEFEQLDGKASLNYTLLTQIISRFLNEEKSFLDSVKEGVFIEGLEQRVACFVTLDGLKIRLSGIFDRIDRVTGTVRIIDYKSGSVDDRATILSKKDTLLTDLNEHKHNKIIQLYLYTYMYRQLQPDVLVTSGIIALKKMKKGILPLTIEGRNLLIQDDLLFFEEFLRSTVAELLNPTIPFTHKESSRYCLFC